MRQGRADNRQAVRVDQDLAAQFKAMGVQASVEPEVDEDDGVFEVMRANADTIRAWLDCGSQWQIAVGAAGMIWLGLDYAGVDVVLQRQHPENPDSVFADIMLMEDEALATFAESHT